jgi:multicomponent Na+:H+ antiporter subunit D
VPWIVAPIVLPLLAATLAFLLGRRALTLALGLAVCGVPLTLVALCLEVWQLGPQRHVVGGWGAPLGIDLYADGLSLLMLIMTAVVGTVTSVYAFGYFVDGPKAHGQQSGDHAGEGDLFWPLWLFLWAALNALFLSADVFNLYVTLELLGLSAVALVNLAAGRAALIAAMRYLLTSILASLVYLLGVALLYAAFGTLDVTDLGRRMTPEPAAWAAVALISLGLALKTALFPLHFWLPPAHANAPTPVSALLSALVVKASFYLLLRLWFEAFPAALTPMAGELLGVLGAAAVLWGSVQALRQQRLKLLVAYSTVAQVGYLFLVFPLATAGAWSGGVYHALSHACAKAAMFLAAGNMLQALGHDRISDLEGISQKLPMSTLTFALAGVTLMGLPPSGGFIAKWLLLTAALDSGQWWWAGVLVIGGLLAATYLFAVLQQLFVPATPTECRQPLSRHLELAPLALALAALLLGLTAAPALELLRIASPFQGR